MWFVSFLPIVFIQRVVGNQYDHVRNYEIVQPLQINKFIDENQNLATIVYGKKDHFEETRFLISAFGKSFDLRLYKNRELLPKSFSAITQKQDGGYIIHEGLENCYYHGYVEGKNDSYVTISTCNGLKGVIYNDEEYHIEPTEEYKNGMTNHSNNHIMYGTNEIVLTKHGKCGGDHLVEDHHLMSKQILLSSSRRRRSLGFKRYIETAVVLDNRMYQKYGIKGGIERAMDIMNKVDNVYKTLDTRVTLVAVIIWNVFDMIKISSKAGVTLSNFKRYTSEVLRGSMRLSHDNAQLITQNDFEGTLVGLAPVGVMCGRASCAINQNHNPNPFVVANTVAHEMGHNLGMYHDEKDCKCSKPPCVMSSYVNLRDSVKSFTSCSQKSFYDGVSTGEMPCVEDYPEKLYGDAVCGNGYKEKDEECDCGTEEDCIKTGAINCCDYSTCKLKKSAQCADGPCCSDCKFKTQGTSCRKKFNEECDLEEYCTGYSNQCPQNFYVKDGTVCENGESYCFQGSCRSLNKQCQKLWGPNAVQTPHEVCYRQNKNGNRFANCGKNVRGSYVACKPKDVMCGKLQCDGKSEKEPLPRLPIIGTGRSVNVVKFTSNVKTIVCRQSITNLGSEIDDPTIAVPGTKCGEGQICIANSCQNLSSIALKSCPARCKNGGVCNNNGNCHCKAGFACPYCELAGPGGSYDSGQGCLVIADCECISTLAKVILVLIFIVFPILIISAYVFFRYRRTGSFRSILPCFDAEPKRSSQTNSRAGARKLDLIISTPISEPISDTAVIQPLSKPVRSPPPPIPSDNPPVPRRAPPAVPRTFGKPPI